MSKNTCKYCGREVRGKFCNVICQNKYAALLKKQNYEVNPDLCMNCGKPLSWKQHLEKGKLLNSHLFQLLLQIYSNQNNLAKE